MPDVIVVKDLVKKYRKSEINAVDGISFNVEEGEFFTFLGPNGAGVVGNKIGLKGPFNGKYSVVQRIMRETGDPRATNLGFALIISSA